MRDLICTVCLRPRDCVTRLDTMQPICEPCAWRIAVRTTDRNADTDDIDEWIA